MKAPLLIISLSLSLATMIAQTTFEKSFGGVNIDYGVSSLQNPNGGSVSVSNSKNSGLGDSDISIVKMNSNGDTVWTNTYGEHGDDFCKTIQKTSNNEYLIAGLTNSMGGDGTDILLIKTDSNGVLLWSKVYGGLGNESAMSVEVTADNCYLIAGYTESFGAGLEDMFILKVDAAGDFLWNKTFGGANDDFANSIKKTTDGGYIITGASNSFSTNSDYDVYLVKIDYNGNKLWSKVIGDSNDNFGNMGLQAVDGNLMVAGSSSSLSNGSDIFIINTDGNGDIVFSKILNSVLNEVANSLIQVTDGQFVLVGTIETVNHDSTILDSSVSKDSLITAPEQTINLGICVIKFDKFGDIAWTKKYGTNGDFNGYDVIETCGGGYFITGTVNPIGTKNFDTYLIKTNSDGGTTCGGVAFTINDSTVTSTSITPSDLASSGTLTTTNKLLIAFAKEYTMTTNCFDEVIDPNTSHSNPIGMANDMIVDDGNTGQILDNGKNDQSRSVTNNSTQNKDISFNVFPNPNIGKEVNLSMTASKGDELLVVVYDALGREHYSKIVVVENENENVYAIDLSEKLVSGIYFITASSIKGNETKRLIVK